MAASGRKQNKKTKHNDGSTDLKKAFDFDIDTLEEKKGSLSDDDTRDGVSVFYHAHYKNTLVGTIVK